MKFPILLFESIVSCPVSGHQWEKSDSISFTSPYQVFLNISKIPLSPLFSRLNKTLSCSLYSYVRCSSPLIIFMPLCWTCSSISMSLLYWGAQGCTQHPSRASLVLDRGEWSPPVASAVVFRSLNTDLLSLTIPFILDFKNKYLFNHIQSDFLLY